MGIQIVDNGKGEAAMFDSTTMWAFGPIFESEYDAINFQRWLSDIKGVHDARRIAENMLASFFTEWQAIDWNSYDEDEIDNHAPFSAQ